MDFQFSIYVSHLCVSVKQTCSGAEFCRFMSRLGALTQRSLCVFGPCRAGYRLCGCLGGTYLLNKQVSRWCPRLGVSSCQVCGCSNSRWAKPGCWLTENLEDVTCGTKKGKETLAGERGSVLLTLSGVALKLTRVYGIIQGKYHTFGRRDTLIPCGACSVPGTNLALVIIRFFQSKNKV